jgi:hypothetical protein
MLKILLTNLIKGINQPLVKLNLTKLPMNVFYMMLCISQLQSMVSI